MAILLGVVLYGLIPYCVYQVCPPTIRWVGAVASVPLGIFVYVRAFERLRHGRRRG
jgi:hypothetical protein